MKLQGTANEDRDRLCMIVYMNTILLSNVRNGHMNKRVSLPIRYVNTCLIAHFFSHVNVSMEKKEVLFVCVAYVNAQIWDNHWHCGHCQKCPLRAV